MRIYPQLGNHVGLCKTKRICSPLLFWSCWRLAASSKKTVIQRSAPDATSVQSSLLFCISSYFFLDTQGAKKFVGGRTTDWVKDGLSHWTFGSEVGCVVPKHPDNRKIGELCLQRCCKMPRVRVTHRRAFSDCFNQAAAIKALGVRNQRKGDQEPGADQQQKEQRGTASLIKNRPCNHSF